jgi:cysteinyl-tRNA synthetase
MLQLHNTLTKRLEPVRVGDPQRITFYSCGPTVYDDAHIGNFRSFLAADVLRRWIESPLSTVQDASGRPIAGAKRVHHVMNITDVGHMTDDDNADGGGDDKMVAAGKRLQEAKKSGKLPAGVELDTSDPRAIARFYEARFREDAIALGLGVAIEAGASEAARLRHMPRATEHVTGTLGMVGMVGVIERLVARGHAYVVGSPGQRVVYFRVQSFASYGSLSGNTLDKLREGEGGRVSADNQAGKQHPADFLLWKEDASHVMQWDSPWGRGYPGWHIECTAMSYALLCEGHGGAPEGDGPLIDLHSGGEDNIFPHHECEIAQSCCAFSNARGTFARAWFHPRFLQVEGAKMSKSKGNFYTARDLFALGHAPGALRLELIRTHYRSNANFTMQGLTDCARMLERWERVRSAATPETTHDLARVAARDELRAGFVQAMHEDMNIAKAIAAVNSFAGACAAPTLLDAQLMGELDAVLGVLALAKPRSVESEIGVWADGLSPEAGVEALLRDRKAARGAKDFKRSDEIRDELARMGYAIKDMPAGKVEVRRA